MGLPLERLRGAPDYGWDDYRKTPLLFLREHGDNIGWEDARYLAEKWPKKFDVPDYFTSGDPNYGGSLLGQANKEWWEENFDELQGKNWWNLGSSGILVRLDLLTKEQKDALRQLDSYPLLDEDRHSELEQEAQNEQWEDWGRSEFKEEIVKLADDSDQEIIEAALDALSNSAFDSLTWVLFQTAEQYPEGGDDVSFPKAKRLFDRPSWQKEGEPGYIEPWDRSMADLARFFPSLAEVKVDVQLAESAWGPWRKKERALRIKKSDLPPAAQPYWQSLTTGEVVNMPYDAEVCRSLYLDCEWDLSSIKEEA